MSNGALNVVSGGGGSIVQQTGCPANVTTCETRTITASQVGSLLGLLLTFVLFSIDVIQDYFADRSRNTGMGIFLLFFLVTTVYCLVSAWVIEEKHYSTLRLLDGNSNGSRKLALIEFWIRVINVTILGFAIAPPQILLRWLAVDRVTWGLLTLGALYEMFLVWDCIVDNGATPGSRELAKSFASWDFGFGCGILAYLWFHSLGWNEAASTCAAVVFGLTLGKCGAALRQCEFRQRLKFANRDRLR